MLKCITFDGDVATLDMLMDHLEKIERALTKVNEQLYAKRVGKPIFLREGNRIIRLHPDEILYVEGYGDYVRVHRTNNKPLLSQNSLKSFEECLGENDFCRVHRSYIVSLSHIEYIERKRIRIGSTNTLIPVSDSYLTVLMGKLCLQT